MKKTIQILLVIVLVAVLLLIIVLAFNPLELRTRLIGSIINSYLSNNIENYTPLQNLPDGSGATADSSDFEAQPDNKHPLLNEDQEKKLESFGVNVEQLPSNITPGMQECFIEKLGQERAGEIVAGDTPSALEFFKAKDCIGK